MELYDMIPAAFEKFNFSEYYIHEEKYLKPALEALGYTNIYFTMGERDSFGPLTRIVHATKDGNRFQFVYG